MAELEKGGDVREVPDAQVAYFKEQGWKPYTPTKGTDKAKEAAK